jgi:hypothetical protein
MDCSCKPLSRHFRRRESGVATVAWKRSSDSRGVYAAEVMRWSCSWEGSLEDVGVAARSGGV